MKNIHTAPFNQELDLVIERTLAAPKELVWRALVEPELVKKWFCPRPWQTVDCRIDLRPGGEFYTEFQSPEGQKFPNVGCFLVTEENERLIWTSALQAGFRPAATATDKDKECAEIIMTCIVTLQSEGNNTHYKATVLHRSVEQTKAHLTMGFYEGWGAGIDQMAEVLQNLKA